jgi:mannosyltransferase OCH1-like enzyme
MKEYLIYLFIFISFIIIYSKNNSNKIFDNSYVNTPYEIPNILWSYWDNIDTIPKNISNMINKRKEKLKYWNHIILSSDTLYKFINIDDIPKNFDTLISAHKADWIRLYLLNKYGGIWIDASIIVNDPMVFNQIYNESIHKRSELTSFYLLNR